MRFLLGVEAHQFLSKVTSPLEDKWAAEADYKTNNSPRISYGSTHLFSKVFTFSRVPKLKNVSEQKKRWVVPAGQARQRRRTQASLQPWCLCVSALSWLAKGDAHSELTAGHKVLQFLSSRTSVDFNFRQTQLCGATNWNPVMKTGAHSLDQPPICDPMNQRISRCHLAPADPSPVTPAVLLAWQASHYPTCRKPFQPLNPKVAF